MLHRSIIATGELHYLAALAALQPDYPTERDFLWYQVECSDVCLVRFS